MPRGPVRARDLRANIKELGFDRGVVETLEHMCDEMAQHREHLRELTELVATCVDQVERMVLAGTTMASKLDQIKREQSEGEQRGEGNT